MEEYALNACVAADVANMDLLIAMWKESAFFPSPLKDEMRQYLTRRLPDLAQAHSLPYSNEDFPDFVQKVYDPRVLEKIFSQESTVNLSTYVKEGGLLRCQAVVEGLENIPGRHPFLMVKKLTRDLGATLYYLLQKGEGKLFVFDAAYKVLKRVAEDNLNCLLKGFVEAFLPGKDYLTLYNFYTVARGGRLLKVGLDDLHALLIAYDVHLDFWEFFVGQKIKVEREDITCYLENYCAETVMKSTAEKVRYLRVIVSHPDCDLQIKRRIAKSIFCNKSVWFVKEKDVSLFLDFGDAQFAHCLIYYALKGTRPRQERPWQKVAFALVEKHGYDENFNPSIHKQKKVLRNLAGLRRILPVEISEESSDSSFSFYSETTDSEEYLIPDDSEESSDPDEYAY